MATITVANFITQYLRPALVNTTEFSDATLGYWIDAALLDISRTFPNKSYATWDTVLGQHNYAYSDSTSAADETNIIYLLNCLYPYVSASADGPAMVRKDHLDEGFYGGDYYEPDNTRQVLYIGAEVAAGKVIYCAAHVVWKTATNNIVNPPEHYELIRLFTIWQAYLRLSTNIATGTVPDSSLLNSMALEARRAELAYRAAYKELAEARATSMVTMGWSVDKWDPNSNKQGTPGSVPPGPIGW